MKDLESLAHTLRVAIYDTHDLPEHVNGLYIHKNRLILLRKNLDYWNRRCTLAHELGHAIRGDVPVSGVFCAHIERRADEFAARLLISPIEYQLAEALHDGHVGGIAYELEVTPHLVEVWRGMYRKIAL